ncbi:unnamed protein product, partial [marine sediment metagenome]
MGNVPTVSHNEGTPGGSDYIRDGDDRIREFKKQIREVVAVDHKMDSSGQGEGWGQHEKITLQVQDPNPTAVADTIILFGKDVDSVCELHSIDEDSHVLQLTSGGILKRTAGQQVQMVNTIVSAVDTGTTVFPNDDTIPQDDEGDEYMTLAITPKSATNKLKIDVVCYLGASTNSTVGVGLFQDATANA